tara:strand:+ start:212 stop:859 length:648 start_codon:yes stop_codon:yes gene_type:complete
MVKKIKTIKRIKKKSLSKKFIFDDDTENYSVKSNLIKLMLLVALIITFSATQIVVIQPTKELAKISGSDLIIKNTAIESGKILQQKLTDNQKIINSEFNNLKISFFKTNEGDPFYKFLSDKAIKNRLTISSITKVSEEDYKEPKKDNPAEFVIYENYKQVYYEMKFEGTFNDYINFIKDIQFEDRSLSANDAIITKVDGDKIKVSSTLIVNIMKI